MAFDLVKFVFATATGACLASAGFLMQGTSKIQSENEELKKEKEALNTNLNSQKSTFRALNAELRYYQGDIKRQDEKIKKLEQEISDHKNAFKVEKSIIENLIDFLG